MQMFKKGKIEHKLKIYTPRTKRNCKTQQNEKIQPAQISYIQSINHGNHFNRMHEKAIKTQKNLTDQFSSYKKKKSKIEEKMDEIESKREMRVDLDLEIEPGEPNKCIFNLSFQLKKCV